jgi:hypothetical protein
MQRLKVIEKAMLTSADEQISLTDPDSRSMANEWARLGHRRLQSVGWLLRCNII